MWLERLAGRLGIAGSTVSDPPRDRREIDPEGPVYAVGDVHGCLDALLALEREIIRDAGTSGGASPLVVMLGDYIDRGPQSAGVLDHLIAPGEGFNRICLAGNHDIYFHRLLKTAQVDRAWYAIGGGETLRSYGIDPDAFAHPGMSRSRRLQILQSHVPDEHRAFLARLPVALLTPAWLFVHAGLRAGVPFDGNTDRDLTETRDSVFADYRDVGRVVVHGHVINDDPILTESRICVDTGACITGCLTAVRLARDAQPSIVAVRVSPDG